jgi:hypothetical protein
MAMAMRTIVKRSVDDCCERSQGSCSVVVTMLMRTIVKVKRKMKMYWQNNSVMCSVSSVLLFVEQVRHPLNPSRTMIRATHGVTLVLQIVSVEYH